MNTKYVVSLELAKRLKALGFPQETDFYRVPQKNNEQVFSKDEVGSDWIDAEYDRIAAPHVGELGDWLPKKEGYISCFTEERKYRLFIWPYVDGESRFRMEISSGAFDSDTEVETRAKMLIYLAEQSLIDPSTL